MSVEVIPGASQKLLRVLFIKEQLKRLNHKLVKLETEEKIVRELTKRKQVRLNINILGLRSRIANLKESEKKLPDVCSDCNGRRSIDLSGSGQMARVCRECKGTGFKKKG